VNGAGTTFLSRLVEIAPTCGFVGLVLDGSDVQAAIDAATDTAVLERAIAVAQDHDEKIWAERLARRLAEIDRTPGSRLLAASILAAYGRCREAEQLIADLDTDPNDPDPNDKAYRRLRGVLCAKAGQAKEAVAIFDSLPERVAGAHPAPIVLSTAYEMLEQCTLTQIEDFIQMLAADYPEHLVVRSFNLRLALLRGDLEKARELSEYPDRLLENLPKYDRRCFTASVADFLESCGHADRLFDFVRDHLISDPTDWALYDRAARAARSAYRERDFVSLIEALPDRDSAEALAILCRWHVDENRLDEASKLLGRIRPLSADLFLKSRLYLSLYSRNQQDIDAAYAACVRCGIALLGATMSYAIHSYYYNCSLERLRDCLTKLEPFAIAGQKQAYFWQIYLRCLIALGDMRKAADCYASLPAGVANSAPLKPFDMYFDAKENRDAMARKKWTQYVVDTRHLCVNARSSYPRTIRLAYTERSDAVLLFVTLYNAADYIGAFLEHYRALGVDHFFVVDNGSSDGSIECLCEQADASVFQNKDSFARSAFGVLWINHLLQRFGLGHWCFHVDIDEFFVFPDCDGSRTLQELLRYCEQNGFACVPAIELDMYPAALAADPGADPFAASCYFDADYVAVEAELPPYVMVQGGIRGRLTGLPLSMQKSPLIRMAADVRYVECNHGTTHLPVADVSGALLHYKFVGDMKGRIARAVARGEHFAGAITYRRLDGAIKVMDPTQSLLSDHSRRYTAPSDLERCGLIRSSPRWTVHKMQHLPEKAAFGPTPG
jgi:Glycosyl transferase family 2